MLITLLGAAFIATPVFMALSDGVKTEEDMISWMMGLPLEKLMMIRSQIHGGVGLLMAGAALHYLPT